MLDAGGGAWQWLCAVGFRAGRQAGRQAGSLAYSITAGALRQCPSAVSRVQDDQLRAMVKQHGGRNWKKIAESLSNKTDVQCLHRWQKVRC